jgi:hypothetical protein
MEQWRKKYFIRDFLPESNSIVVEFVDFGLEKTIILPVDNDKYPVGQELDNYIMGFSPVKEKAPQPKKAINNDEIEVLLTRNSKHTLTKSKLRNAALYERDIALSSSDWTQLPDVQSTLSEEEKIRWKNFRQELRDITKQDGFPEKFDWPKRPYILGVTIFDE